MKSGRLFNVVLLLVSACTQAHGQSTNPCGVIASISPAAADSVVAFGARIELTSVSTNAASVEWLIDGWFSGITNSLFTYNAGAGTHKISLVAHNGPCTDTTTVFYFCAGQPHDIDSSMFANYGLFNTFEYSTSIDATRDGGFVLGGYGTLINDHYCGHQGLVVKLRERGCVDWSKQIRDTISYCGYGDVKLIYSSAPDSSYYVSGTGFLMKLDNNGNQVWNNIYRVVGFPYNYVNPVRMTGDDQGNIYLINQSMDWGWSITKINSSGNIVWSKYYLVQRTTDPTHLNVSNPYGITWLNGKIYVTGGILKDGGTHYFDFLCKIDAITGNTDWQYGYENQLNPGSMSFDQVSNYGNLVMVAGTDGGGEGVYLIDSQGNMLKTIKAKFNTSFAPHITKAGADSKGNIYIMQWTETALPLQPYYYYYTNFVKIDTSFNKYWGLIYPRWYFNDMAVSKNDFGAIGTDFGLEASAFWASLDLRFLKVNTQLDNLSNYGSSNYCNYYTNDYTLTTMPMRRVDFTWAVDSVLSVNIESVKMYVVTDAHIESRYTCPDFVDSCSLMKISGPTTACSYNDAYTYYVHRNRKCSLAPQWKLSKGALIVAQTDSSVTVRFPGFGTFGISCELKSCIPVFDSLTMVLKSKAATLNLGKDTLICDQTTITLHAGNKFLLYQWQDGSTDSLFTVTKPGWYWVQASDSCSNMLRDSILIKPYGGTAIDVGPDRTKCNSDTIHLNAPPGFLNYTWSNDYKISSTSSQNVVVNPLVDTAYYLKAEKIAGCFDYDTVRVRVNISPPIHLGADKSFCSGDSAAFDAGSGFIAYTWSNGSNSPQITVKTVGTFSVAATTIDGCNSFDTARVVSVFANPVVTLDHTPTLCIGASRLLDAGKFFSYVWNDGSTVERIMVNDVGTYAVHVTDNNGCKGSDTTVITTMLPLPTDFLPADTLICSYDKLSLSSLRHYNSYLWSTGASTATITVTQPGNYWLLVKDVNGCTGADTVAVKPKDCMKGFYIPTAFTPNADGKNDVFRPLLFGNVKKYQFTIYNRWGQILFHTTEVGEGWDGTVAGVPQDPNVFVWTCVYQLDGEGTKSEKGTVTLVR